MPTVSMGTLAYSHLIALSVGLIIGAYIGYRVTRRFCKPKKESSIERHTAPKA